jgi:hypothetical protein
MPAARPMILAGLILTLLLTLGGCTSHPLSAPTPLPEGQTNQTFPLNLKREVDILFLVDKSPTMKDEQTALAQNFPRFIEVLEGIQGGLPDIHLGVITQDMGVGGLEEGGAVGQSCTKESNDGGRLRNQRAPLAAPGCQPPSGRFIRDVARADGSRDRNYTGSLADTFACIAQVGPDGCGFEQHLLAIAKALDGSVPENAGFLRKDAYLAIVILSDEDDCSAREPGQMFGPDSPTMGPFSDWRCAEHGWTCGGQKMTRSPASYESCEPAESSPYMFHPQQVADVVRSLKADPERIMVATIIGPATPVRTGMDSLDRFGLLPSCTNGQQNAEPMPRIKYFADKVSKQSTPVSICNDDLSSGLTQIAQVLRRLIEKTCLGAAPADLDGNPDNGLQADCSVVERPLHPAPGVASKVVPACPGPAGGQPCWSLVADPTSCAASGYRVDVERGGAAVPEDTMLDVSCLVTK